MTDTNRHSVANGEVAIASAGEADPSVGAGGASEALPGAIENWPARQLATALKAGRMGSWTLDLATGELTSSDTCKANYGRAPSDPFTYQDLAESVHPDDLATWRAAVARAIDAVDEFEIEYRTYWPDGSLHGVLVRGNCFADDTGRTASLAGVSIDLTERREAEERLRRSEERFRAFVTASADVVYRMSADWREMHHLDGREFIADTRESSATWLEQYIEPADRPLVTAAIDQAIRTKGIFALEHRVIRVDGSLGWTFSRAVPILDGQGRIVEWFGAASDITERKRADLNARLLIDVNHRLGSLSDPDAIEQATIDLVGAFLGVSHCCFAHITTDEGATVAREYRASVAPSLVGQHRVATYHPSGQIARLLRGETVASHDVSVDPAAASHLAETGIRAFVCTPILFSGKWDATLSVCSLTPRAWRDDEVEVLRDVAARVWPLIERARAVAAARDSQARFDIVRNGTQVGFWFCDLPFDKLVWDNRVKEHFWLPPEAEVTIDTFYERLHPADRAPTRRAIDQSIADRTQYDIEYRTVSPDGREKWIRAIGRTFYNAHDTPVRFDGVTLDITQPKRAEEALKENDRRKDEFLAMLAHELRNPLAPIRNAAQVLRLASPADASQRWAGEVIERQTQHLTRLVDDLLDVSRITTGKVVLQREPLDVATIITSAVETTRPVIEARKHRLTVTVPPDPLWVEGDLTRLAQVVSNLLNNAAKYTDDGGQIGVVALREADEAVIRVHDDGLGISADLLPHIFDLFTQADRSLDRSQGGLGIGLTLVRQLVDMHAGRVEARSDGAGRGSTFIVRLPLRPESGLGSRQPGQAAVAPVAHPSPGKLRVLVVEDNLDSAEMLSFLLKLGGDETRTAHDGPAALECAWQFRPQVILCDIGLPGMSGYEIAQQLRARPEFAPMRLIALSGYGQDEDRRRSKEAGFDYHLTKPVEPAVLTALMDSLKSSGPVA